MPRRTQMEKCYSAIVKFKLDWDNVGIIGKNSIPSIHGNDRKKERKTQPTTTTTEPVSHAVQWGKSHKPKLIMTELLQVY